MTRRNSSLRSLTRDGSGGLYIVIAQRIDEGSGKSGKMEIGGKSGESG